MSKKNKTENKNNSKKSENKNIQSNVDNTKMANNKKTIGEVWDLEPILAGKNLDTWLKEINSDVEKFKKNREILNNKITPTKILEIIKLEEKISINLTKIHSYYGLKCYENFNDSKSLATDMKLKNLSAEINNNTLFFGLWFMHLDDKIAQKIINSIELKEYKYYLEEIRKDKQYTKTEEIEKILNIKNITGLGSYSELYNIHTNNYEFELNGKKISKEELIAKCKSENPSERETAYNIILSRYSKDSTLLSQIYKNIVLSWNNESLKIRGYPSSINVRNNANDVSDKSVQVLFSTIKKNNKLFQDYFKLKYELNKKAGEKYPYSRYHLYAPLKIKLEKKYSYEESKNIVLDTYKKFDERFYIAAKKIFDAKHVHTHPTVGKQGGAFCMGVTKDVLPYVLLNHTDRLRDVFTIIHEFGHAIHDVFAFEKQPHILWHASLPMAETASIFSEMILADRLLKESKDSNEKKYILCQLLDDQFASIQRQAYFVMFEIYAHEKILQGVADTDLDEKYSELLKEQFGDMSMPKEFNKEWTYLPHIFEYPFYCYAYAWGKLFVLALFEMYRKEGKKFIDKYIELLQSGGNGSPADLMKKLGADPESEEFWQKGFNIIREEIEELKKLK
jgi:oligoendopeptidase F